MYSSLVIFISGECLLLLYSLFYLVLGGCLAEMNGPNFLPFSLSVCRC